MEIDAFPAEIKTPADPPARVEAADIKPV